MHVCDVSVRQNAATDRGSRSDRPRYHKRYPFSTLLTPNLTLTFWPRPMTLNFHPRRAMAMTDTRAESQGQRLADSEDGGKTNASWTSRRRRQRNQIAEFGVIDHRCRQGDFTPGELTRGRDDFLWPHDDRSATWPSTKQTDGRTRPTAVPSPLTHRMTLAARSGQRQYVGRNDVTESVVTIRAPFCGHNAIHCAELNGGDLSCYSNEKLVSYRRRTARCVVVSVEILPIATQQCRNYLYDKSWTNRYYEVAGLRWVDM